MLDWIAWFGFKDIRLTVNVNYLKSEAWQSLVSGADSLWFNVDYEVVEDAKYSTQNIHLRPQNAKGFCIIHVYLTFSFFGSFEKNL